MLVILTIAALTARVEALGDVRPGLAQPAVEAALAAGTLDVPAELLLSIAWGESRLEPSPRGRGRACGILQVVPEDIGLPHAATCALWARDLAAAFAAGVLEIRTELADRRVHRDLRLALLYRACGNAAFAGTCEKRAYPSWVLRRAARLGGE